MTLLKVIENQQIYGAPTHTHQLLDLTLKEIVQAGKITNAYQLFALGRVAMFFKNGLKSVDLQMQSPVNFESGETNTELKMHLKSLTDMEIVDLAKYLLSCIDAGECVLHHADQPIEEWVKFVLQKQD